MEYARTVERQFSAGAEAQLRIVNRRGSLEVRGEDRADIEFSAILRVSAGSEQEADRLFDAVGLPMSDHEGTVEIGPPDFDDFDGLFGARLRRTPRLEMVAVVPRGCDVHASNRAGSISVRGVRATVDVDGRTGRVDVRDIDGEVTAETRTGSIRLTSVRGAVRAETRTGGVEVEDIDGDVTLSTRTGGIKLENIDGAIEVHSRTGGVRCRGPIAHPVDISVNTGAIRLAVPRDSSFFLDAESRSGSVRSDLEVNTASEPDADAPTVRLKTDRGAIRVGATER